MKILFISRPNNQARYFTKLRDNMPFSSSIHIIGSRHYRSILNWRDWFAFDPSDVVRIQVIRRLKKFPVLSKRKMLIKSYSIVIGIKERNRYMKYRSLLKDINPGSVGLWNGKKLPTETIVIAAKSLRIPVVFFENGLLPNTCTIDSNGVNQESSLPRLPDFYLNYQFKENEKPIQALAPRPPLKSRKKQAIKQLPEKYLFVPFQVPDDTQIVRYSPWIESMEMLYDCVVAAVSNSRESDLKVVFKEHPSWPSHYTSLYENNECAIFANGNDTPSLIENSLAVITINSTVGLESVLLNKPVIALGQACYGIDDLVQTASNQTELNRTLDNIINGWKPDAKLRKSYFRYLNEVYCIPRKWSEAEAEHFPAAAKRILGADEFTLSIRSHGATE